MRRRPDLLRITVIIDGLSEVRIFFQMFIPTMKSTYAAAAVITLSLIHISR